MKKSPFSLLPLFIGLTPLLGLGFLTSSTLAQAIYTTPYNFSTLVGQNGGGYADGTAATALFNQPTGVAVDSSGNLYISDGSNYVVRKVTPTGITTTIAGQPLVSGSIDGSGSAALFGQLNGIAIDNLGNLYVTDSTYNTVRKLSLSAGSWTTTTLVSKTAGLNNPNGIVVDSSGNIYVADTNNFVVRKITPSGTMTTLAGSLGKVGINDGTGSSASFGSPTGIALDLSGNLYVTDSSASTLRKVTQAGVVTTLGGYSGAPVIADGPLSTQIGEFSHLTAIASDTSGNFYISDGNNSSYIRQITAAGIISTLAGTNSPGGTDGTGSSASFANVKGIAVDSSGNVYVVNTGTSTIRKGYSSSVLKITSQPSILNATITLGFTVQLQVSATGGNNLSYQWYFNGAALSNSSTITGATSNVLSLSAFNTNEIGAYYVVITNASSSVTSQTVYVALPVSITAQPSSQTVIAGSKATLTVTATGTTPTYQWYLNGSAIAAATASSYTISNVQSANVGTYTVVVSNATSSVTSQNATLSLLNPVITTQPQSVLGPLGGSVTLSVAATGLGNSYQWYLNGTVIAGATNPSLPLTSLKTSDAGNYTVIISNIYGSITSSSATLSLGSTITSNPGRLINLSVLSMDGPASQLLTVGFALGGAGTSGSENLLIRASGPSLSTFGVASALADPTLTVFQGSTTVASNDNWGSTAANISTVTAAEAATGAFPLASNSSLDAALVQALPSVSGGYSVQVAGKNSATGNTLAEIYDNTPAGTYTSTTPRLINVSCLQLVPSGGILTAGFTIGGSTAEKVLIRASGPTLSTFGVLGAMSDPTLTVFSGSTSIASNSGWGFSLANQAAVTDAEASTGAFTYTSSTSHDSAIVLTLQPGLYSVQATSSSNTAGVTLIEVYEVQ